MATDNLAKNKSPKRCLIYCQ